MDKKPSKRELQEIEDALCQEYLDELSVIVLVRGSVNNLPHYAYARIKADKYNAFKRAEMLGNYDLAEYGEILASGSGIEPSDDVKASMAREYGASERFEEDLMESLVPFIKANENPDDLK